MKPIEMRNVLFLFVAFAVAGGSAFGGRATGPLKKSEVNPRYFADPNGKIVYLTGAHTWNNLVDMGTTDPPAAFDYDGYLDFLERHKHNFIRMWAWELTKWDTEANGQKEVHFVAPHPWMRTGPGAALDGKPKFDLTKFNPDYFARLHSRSMAAAERGIYVSVMLFEGWGMQFVKGAWEGHPFHPANNVNGIGKDIQAGIQIHELVSRPILAVQEAYVRRVVDAVNDLDNVLYEVSNENHPPSTLWQYHIINLIHGIEKSKPKQHPVGMTFQYKGGSNQMLFESPAEWISPNREGGYRDDPPPSDGAKVILSDTDHLWGIGGNQAWVWKSFTRGMNPLFMDPYKGKVLSGKNEATWEQVRRSLGFTRAIAERVGLLRMTPHPELSSTGYCLADPGNEYVVYRPAEDEARITMRLPAGEYAVEWINPDNGLAVRRNRFKVTETEAVFESPVPGGCVLCLRREAGKARQ